MEVIQLAGYTEEEKLEIAKRYLVPRQIERNGLKRSQIAFSDTGLRRIVAEYTREAGVRNLEREIGAACRKVARRVAEGTLERKVTVTAPRVRELLGRPRVQPEARRRTSQPGVATGLAWTPVGGDVLFVEATAMPSLRSRPPALTVTGQLGDVMKESAQAALSWVRSRRADDEEWFARHDLHVHVPAGAVPKDGPSAGITMATALMSLVHRPPRARRHGDDRRDHAHRPGAADRRAQGEGARGAAGRDHARDRPAPQRARHRGLPGPPAHGHRVRLGVGDRRGARVGLIAAR